MKLIKMKRREILEGGRKIIGEEGEGGGEIIIIKEDTMILMKRKEEIEGEIWTINIKIENVIIKMKFRIRKIKKDKIKAIKSRLNPKNKFENSN